MDEKGCIAPDPRHLQMLEELAELGMELAREVQMLAKSRLVEARVSGWDGNLPKDPAAPFVKIAQAVRRTLALKVALKEGLVPAPFPVAEARTPNPSADRPLRDAAEPTDRAERPLSLRALIAEDLRGDLDDRERLLDFPTERGRPRPPRRPSSPISLRRSPNPATARRSRRRGRRRRTIVSPPGGRTPAPWPLTFGRRIKRQMGSSSSDRRAATADIPSAVLFSWTEGP